MKKIQIIFAVFFAALVCATSCGKEDKKSNEPEQPAAKFLTASEFASSNWTGTDSNGEVTLSVKSTTEMALKYFVQNTVSKKTDEKTPKNVTITYTFDETAGMFSGKGNDGAEYSGTLTSKTAMTLKLPSGGVSLTKN